MSEAPGLAELFARVRRLVLVTGTNGKSTTAHLIEQILARAGTLTLRNADGANLPAGIASMLARAPLLAARTVVLEVDEGSLPAVAPPARPDILVVTNVFRDQLDRYGEVDAVAALIREAAAATPAGCVIVANADDPAVADIALRAGRRAVFFGLDFGGRDDPGPAADAVLCPRCGRSLAFSRAFLSHLGHYRCAACGFARPTPDVAATEVTFDGADGVSFTTATLETRTRLVGLHGLYNALAALATARALGIPDAVARSALERAGPMPGRSEWIEHGGRRVFLGLVKNPAGFEAMTGALAAVGGPRHVLLLLNDRRADSGDVSWIWDARFEVFRADRVSIGGSRAEALALRLKYAGVDHAQPPLRDHGRALESAVAATPEGAPLYVLLNYSAMIDLFGALGKPLTPA